MWHAQDASYRPPSTRAPEEWASKHGDKNYALEVAQNPIRARMCGFGDKDRRPLAPAAVAKLVVTDKNGRLIPPDSIQVAFFIVLVDLWDEYGQHETNLVRNAVPHGTTSRRYRGQRSDSQPLSQRHKGSLSDSQATPYPAGTNGTASQLPHGEETPISPVRETVNGSSTGKRKRGRHTSDLTEVNPGEVDVTRTAIEEVPTHPFFPTQDTTLYSATYTPQEFIPFGSYFAPTFTQAPQTLTYATASTSTSTRDAGVAGALPLMTQATQLYDNHEQHNGASSYATDTTGTSAQAYANPTDTTQQQQHNGSSSQTFPTEPQQPTFSTPSYPSEEPLEYARTLIGPLAASAQTINDENDEPGIFFLFQDLSVRTEGTFRLRMRLVNVGGPPAPEPGASSVRTDISTVLAQVFTDPFIVFSAKKFPGVPAQTALSQRLLQQGLKIPGRTRNATKGGANQRKRRKVDGDEWIPAGGGSNSDEE